MSIFFYKKREILLFGVIAFLFTTSFYENSFNIVLPDYFNKFQKDSESLVVGKIVADKFGISKSSNFNLLKLKLLSNIDSGHTNKIYEAYQFINYDEIGDLSTSIVDLNDDIYRHGIAKNFAGIVVRSVEGKSFDSYLGRRIILGNQQRLVVSVQSQGYLSFIRLSGDPVYKFVSKANVIFSGAKIQSNDLHISDYKSQHGLQGMIFSKLAKLGWTLKRMWKLNSFLLAITFTTLIFLFAKIFSKTFAICFFFSILFSPWVTLFGKNLYWVPFTWFLPAIFSCSYYLVKSNLGKIVSIVFLFLCFVFKCLCGYEYISSVILFASAPFIFKFLMATLSRSDWKYPFKNIVLICLVGTIGFSTALLIHAKKRGETLKAGIESIYEQDVKRRTYGGDSEKFKQVANSLKSSPLEVLKIYVYDWRTPFIWSIHGKYFKIILIFSFLSLIYFRTKLKIVNDFSISIFFTFILPPLSWYVLGKAHSHVHRHMNYVLWYFGFIATLLFIFWECFKDHLSKIFIEKDFN